MLTPDLVHSSPITLAEFLAFIELPENAERDFELWEGEIIEMPKPNPLHNEIALLIAMYLKFYTLQQTGIGVVFGDNTEYSPADDVLVIPDVSFIAADKVIYPYPQSFPFTPTIAVEVISPSNSHHEMLSKIDLYLHYGTQQVWLVYPQDQAIHIYQATDDGDLRVRRWGATDTLTVPDLLPEFRLSVAECFPAMPANNAS